ncbi:MAG: ATP-binding cassette domain-containing protein, partial [bacterium]
RQSFLFRKASHHPENQINIKIVDILTSFDTVKIFTKENSEMTSLREIFGIWKPRVWRYDLMHRYLQLSLGLTGSIILIIPTIFLIKEYQLSLVSIGSMIVILTYLFGFAPKLQSLVYNLRDFIKHFADFSSFVELLTLERSINDPKIPKYLERPRGEIEFDDVSFEYKQRDMTINNLSLKVEPNQTIAFVGPSGAGKTTLIKLLMRFYEVNSGKVLIDGVDVRELKQKDLRGLIGVVPQDPIMFNNTIAFNVGYALSNLKVVPADIDIKDTTSALLKYEFSETDKSLIVEACKKAQIEEFIESLPQKYETIIGERGIRLSGGQRQRLAIARMIVKNPKILVFDEATSMLDSESEKLIQKAFKEFSANKTTIIIAHRLSTIVNADKIFVLEKGRIVQMGTHKELLQTDGMYKTLWTIQSSGFEVN